MEYMNAAQRAQYAELVAKWGAYKTLKVDDYVRIELLACVMVEVSELQNYVNTNGTTYQVKAFAQNALGWSTPSALVSVTLPPMASTVPGANG